MVAGGRAGERPSFAAATNFAAGSSPNSVAAADVNGDGRPDLLVANNGSTNVSVLLNTTAPGATVPSFAAATNFAAGTGPASVAAADVNGDGRPDLLVANCISSTVSVLLNTTAPGATMPSFVAPDQTSPSGPPALRGGGGRERRRPPGPARRQLRAPTTCRCC